MKPSPCKTTIPKRFLWFKWIETNYNHNFVYSDRNMRKCSKCNLKQFLFSREWDYSYGFYDEDWRETI